MTYHVTVGDRTWVVELGASGVAVDGKAVEIDFDRIGGGPIRSLVVEGASHRIAARRVETECWELHVRGRRLRAHVVDERTRVIRDMTGASSVPVGPKPVVAPMPGMIVRLEVAEGDVVEAGQGVVIVEAMKMENELTADGAGLVRSVLVDEGQAVERGQLLVDLAPLEGGPDGAGSPDHVEDGPRGSK